ncbi:MAG: hypothetical protein GX621_07440, partial [Pirellulaceae bacterium]|nr:hypothetical protein [Pirellulaceae bacterium]
MKSSLTLVLLPLLAVALFATPAWAVSYYWNFDPLETGDFWTEANWNPEGMPGSDDYAYVNNGGTAEIDGDGSLSRLYLGTSVTGDLNALAGTVEVTSGTLTVRQLNVGRYNYDNEGTFTVQSGAEVVAPNFYVGYGASGTSGLGTVTVMGSLTFSGDARIGHASDNTAGSASTGTFNVQGGGHVSGSTDVWLGYRNGSVGTLNVTGNGSLFSTSAKLRVAMRGAGTVNVGSGGEIACGTLDIGADQATAVGIVNLNSGGLITTGSVAMGNTANPATSVLNFDGGVLRATGDNVNFIVDKNSDLLPSHVYVKSGGATIDTNGFDVVAHTALEQASGSTGGLIKNGEGRLVLASGANTYTGTTAVNAGTLVAHGAMSPITVAAGATIMPGAWDAANAKLVDASLENVTLTTSSLTLAHGTRIGTVLCGDEYGVDGVNRIATGSLAVAGGGNATIGVELAGVTPTAAGGFDIITYGTKTGTFSFLTEYDSEGTLATNIVDTGSAVRVEFAGISDYWTGGGLNDNFSNAANWSSVAAPNGANRRALFTGIGQTVDLDVNVTLSSLVFDAGDFDLRPVGGTSLTLDSSIAQKTQISNVAGSNTVSAPILLNKDTRITVAQVDDTLTLNGPVTGLGRIEKVGDGTLAMANLGGGPVGDLVLGGGTFRYTGATATTSR